MKFIVTTANAGITASKQTLSLCLEHCEGAGISERCGTRGVVETMESKSKLERGQEFRGLVHSDDTE